MDNSELSNMKEESSNFYLIIELTPEEHEIWHMGGMLKENFLKQQTTMQLYHETDSFNRKLHIEYYQSQIKRLKEIGKKDKQFNRLVYEQSKNNG